MDAYVYSPFDSAGREIRLLTLSPGQSRGQVLQCTLQHAILSSTAPPDYETISYCWGQSPVYKTILIDGKQLSVPESAEQTLRLLLPVDEPRVLWIDSVCINQADVVERGEQVKLMRDIYSASQGNIFNLGEQDDSTGRAVENIRTIAEEVRQQMNVSSAAEAYKLVRATVTSDRLHTAIDAPALTTFFSRPWFSRTWALQEAVLPTHNDCKCGIWDSDFDHILLVATWLILPGRWQIPHSLLSLPGLYNAHTIQSSRSNLPRISPLQLLLMQCSTRQATDVRDRVFGVLGLAIQGSETPVLLTPDYHKPTSTVFRDATRYTIQQSQNLWMLRFVSHPSEAHVCSDGFPSWVPRFDRTWYSDSGPPTLSAVYGHPRGQWSSADPKCDLTGGSQDVLHLRGVMLDRITELSGVFGTAECRPFLQDMLQSFDADPSPKARFARALTTGVDHNYERAGSENATRFDHWLTFLGNGTADQLKGLRDLPEDASESLREATRFSQAMGQACLFRRWASTESKLMAMVPRVTRPGDVIVACSGANLPYVLRKTKEDEYQLLGECWFEDHVDGEPFEDEAFASRSVTFTIR